MTENEFLLTDRLQKIRQIIGQYGEENFYVSFSGGKDSTVLHYLIDEALPGNSIPRVYANTGIELNIVRDFVIELQKSDRRIEIIKPSVPIEPMLKRDGYPFKSKSHSNFVERYKRAGKTLSVKQYLGEREDKKPWSSEKSCPDILKYQFTPDFDRLKISDKCCLRMKEEPLQNWGKKNGRRLAIIGITGDEGGRRGNAVCMSWQSKSRFNFQPLMPVSKEFEDWYIAERNIKLCDIYGEPYNFPRTGCKGCPFAVNLQRELDILEKFFPAERRQCELIWGPVYEEYRRIGYRLKKPAPKYEAKQMTIFDYIGGGLI
jgi:3'-phosphoadenosine 5'-phosphosulfate sulfotransferase (PAPS reductase)/FAD synthetase